MVFFRKRFLRSVAVVRRFGTEFSISVVGNSMSGRDAVMAAWDALHGAMRAWGIRSREGLSECVHAQGFPQPRWGAHFSGRAQERLLNATANHDARVSALETTYVQVSLQACEQGVRELDQNLLKGRTIDAPALPAGSWEALDPINWLKCSRSDSQCCSFARSVPGTLQARSPNRTSRASRCSHGRGRSEGDQSVEIVHSVALRVVAPSSRAVTCEQG